MSRMKAWNMTVQWLVSVKKFRGNLRRKKGWGKKQWGVTKTKVEIGAGIVKEAAWALQRKVQAA